MKRHKLAVVLAVILIPAVVLAGWLVAQNVLGATSGSAKDAKGCEGLSDYHEEVFALWSDNPVEGLKDREALSLSSDEWLELADAALKFQRGFNQIGPPDFAAEWHQALIESFGIVEQASLAIADGGLFVGLVFQEPFDEAEARLEAAVETGTAVCADFSDFARDYEALGDEGEGTPAAESPAATRDE